MLVPHTDYSKVGLLVSKVDDMIMKRQAIININIERAYLLIHSIEAKLESSLQLWQRENVHRVITSSLNPALTKPQPDPKHRQCQQR